MDYLLLVLWGVITCIVVCLPDPPKKIKVKVTHPKLKKPFVMKITTTNKEFALSEAKRVWHDCKCELI